MGSVRVTFACANGLEQLCESFVTRAKGPVVRSKRVEQRGSGHRRRAKVVRRVRVPREGR